MTPEYCDRCGAGVVGETCSLCGRPVAQMTDTAPVVEHSSPAPLVTASAPATESSSAPMAAVAPRPRKVGAVLVPLGVVAVIAIAGIAWFTGTRSASNISVDSAPDTDYSVTDDYASDGHSANPDDSQSSVSRTSLEPLDLTRVEGSDLDVELSIELDAERGGIAQTIVSHGDLINIRDYADAWKLLSVSSQNKASSYDDWQEGVHTSQWRELVIYSIEIQGDSATADTRLTTSQDPQYGSGSGCLTWSLTYHMIRVGAQWQIDKAKGESIAC